MKRLPMWENRLKTLVLLSLLSGLFLVLGDFLGGYQGLVIAFIFACIMNFVSYFFSDKIVLALYKAHPLEREHYSAIYKIVEELSFSLGIPAPKLWLITNPMANAFATGRNPSHASVALTTGLLSLLDIHELRGVLAHELSHIKNRDILVTTIAATIAAAIGFLANTIQHMALWQSTDRRRDRGINPITSFIIALIMPLAAALIRLAISRSREYMADETGAQVSNDPLALASALQKLHHHIPMAHLHNNTINASTAPLFIIHPFLSEGITNLFSTHPPTKKRIERLHKLHDQISHL
jgi:heat shock protein HtpX